MANLTDLAVRIAQDINAARDYTDLQVETISGLDPVLVNNMQDLLDQFQGGMDATDVAVAALVGSSGTASRAQVDARADVRVDALAVTKSGHDPAVAALVGTSGTASQTQVDGRVSTLAITKAGHDAAVAALVDDDGSALRGELTRSGALPVGRGELVRNVLDYGAIGNGTANDTAAIQAAINSLPAGGAVYLPKGIYRLTSPLVLRSGVTLRGDSQRTSSLKVSIPDVSAVKIHGTAASSTIVQVSLERLHISGPGKNSSGTAPGIDIKWASVDVNLDQLWVVGWASHGVLAVDSYSMTFRQCLFDGNGGDGFHGETNINNVTFDRTISILNAGHGYRVTGGTTLKFLNADAESNGGNGFNLRYTFAASLDTCHTENNGGANIYLHYRAPGGLSEKTNAANIQGCLIQGSGNTERGLVIDGASRTTVQGNWFSGHTSHHIQITANADRTWIGPNTYAGAAATELEDASASTVAMDYDAQNFCARTDILRYRPRAAAPLVLARGQVWWDSVADQLRARDASRTRTIFTGYDGSLLVDASPIASGAIGSITIGVSGAEIGDTATVAPPQGLPEGLMLSAFVLLPGTVRIRILNTTAATISPPSGRWRVNVIKSSP